MKAFFSLENLDEYVVGLPSPTATFAYMTLFIVDEKNVNVLHF